MQVNAIQPPAEWISTERVKLDQPPVTPENRSKFSTTENPPELYDRQENLEKLKDVLKDHNVTLKFRQDEETKAMIVELVNDQTGEAIRQIPSEISLKLAAVFVKMQGQFIDRTE